MTDALAADAAVIERVLRHIDDKTTDLSGGVWREPVENYVSRGRFTQEISRVFRGTPIAFCPSAALADSGAFVARDCAGVPVVAMRGTDGAVRAFRNACRHRGVQLVEGAGCKAALTCRYHGWTYGLDGRLRGVPDDHGFPGLDRAAHGLVPVATTETQGLVFVQQEGAPQPPDLRDMPNLFGEGWSVVGFSSQTIEANWKVLAEGFLEGYHLRSTHGDTFYPIQFDNLNVVEAFGRNSRVTFPYRRIEKQRALPAAERRAEGMLTQVYHLFPNVMIATFPTNVTMTVIEPVSVDRSRFVTWTLSDRAASDEQREAIAQGRDFVAAGLAEDRDMALAIQRGLASGANEVFTFGLFEGAIAHLHRGLAAALRTGE